MVASAGGDQSASRDGESRSLRHALRRAREGDAEAIGKLLDASRDYLVLMAHRDLAEELRAKVSPSDVVQETCVKAVENFTQFQGESKEQWYSWLRQILNRQMRDLHRRYIYADLRNVRREKELDASCEAQAIDSETPSHDASRRENVEHVTGAIARLPDEYQVVLRLREWEKLSFAEVGEQLGRSADAARQLWYRAVERLSQELDHGE